jgi:hypothetical protein
LACTQGVPECITRNLKEPGLRPLRRTQAIQVLDDPEEYVLKEVVRFDAGRDAASQKRS